MPINIQYTDEQESHPIKMVVFGYSGSEKTRLCATAPKVIILSAEKGLLSLKKEHVPFVEIKTLKDVNDAYNNLKNDNRFETICIDSLSEIADLLIDTLKKDPDLKDKRQAYGKLGDTILPMIRKFRDLENKNIVFITKAKMVENDYTGRTTIEPMIPGQLVPLNLPYLVDELLYMEVNRKGESKLLCKPKSGILIKDRSGELDAVEEPNLTNIFNKIKGIK